MKKKYLIFFTLLLAVFISGIISAEQSYCCEKTIDGAWCQNAPDEAQCDALLQKSSTLCESTCYCPLGICINTREGTCLDTPKRVCQENGGIWYAKSKTVAKSCLGDETKYAESSDELPQCKEGCCLIGEEAAYVTQTRCKRLSSVYGLNGDFRADITNEAECIASAVSDKKGACVFGEDYEKTCRMTTQKECLAMKSSAEVVEEEDKGFFANLWGNLAGKEEEQTLTIATTFHPGYLCSATVLGTNCGPRGGTTCIEGEDAVYFLDTCGNLANIYDSTKLNDENYWTYLKDASESCGYGSSNVNSKTCGNCDYYSGSTCESYREGNNVAPKYGSNICGDLKCTYEGQTYEHGESWCVTNTKRGVDENLPGSQYFRLVCYDGEVTVESCDPWRATVCKETTVGNFRNAVCMANQWQDCTIQTSKEDCLDATTRDCTWVEGYSILKDEKGYELVVDSEGKLVEQNKDKYGFPEDNRKKASCVPLYPIGLNFWENDTTAGEICKLGTYNCLVEYEFRTISLTTKKEIAQKNEVKRQKCVKNCRCIPNYQYGDSNKCKEGCESHEDFLKSIQKICGSLGDCGIGVNYVGQEGKNDKFVIEFGEVK